MASFTNSIESAKFALFFSKNDFSDLKEAIEILGYSSVFYYDSIITFGAGAGSINSDLSLIFLRSRSFTSKSAYKSTNFYLRRSICSWL